MIIGGCDRGATAEANGLEARSIQGFPKLAFLASLYDLGRYIVRELGWARVGRVPSALGFYLAQRTCTDTVHPTILTVRV
jgi:hypothetical protein